MNLDRIGMIAPGISRTTIIDVLSDTPEFERYKSRLVIELIALKRLSIIFICHTTNYIVHRVPCPLILNHDNRSRNRLQTVILTTS